MNNSVSVIIVNFKSQEYLKRCLESLRLLILSKEILEIVVINNDSKENLSFLTEDFPDIRVVGNKNDGLGKAWNLGRKLSQGEILWFLNPDTEIVENSLKGIKKAFDEDERLAVIGPRLITEKGVSQFWSAGKETGLLDIALNNAGWIRSRRIWESQSPTETDWVSGAAFFLRASHFDRLGGFDEKIVRYFEDMDFCRRARKEGLKVLFYPLFSVRHFCGRSHKDKRQQKIDFYSSQDYYFRKHHGSIQSAILRTLRRLLLLT
ncbi:MAG: glycosyltransferase family 2 protein [Patescibacteria group bacterium]